MKIIFYVLKAKHNYINPPAHPATHYSLSINDDMTRVAMGHRKPGPTMQWVPRSGSWGVGVARHCFCFNMVALTDVNGSRIRGFSTEQSEPVSKAII